MAILHEERTLDLHADSAEWCPQPGSQDYLAVGTYQLDEASNQRHGRWAVITVCMLSIAQEAARLQTQISRCPPACCRLYLFTVSHEHTDQQQGWRLQERATLQCSGIFDMRWAPHTASPMLALALSSGDVQLVQQQSHEWHPMAATNIGRGMVVTVDWARHAAREGRAAASTSTGQLAIVQVNRQGSGPIRVVTEDIPTAAMSTLVYAPHLAGSRGCREQSLILARP
jgi:hypothetical protein